MPVMNLDWLHVIIGLISGCAGAAGGLVAGVWRIAHIEQGIREDFQAAIARTEHEIEAKVEALVGQFQEAFSGLRQKINDVELQTEREFVGKSGFEDFRKEYREDVRNLMDKIDRMGSPKRQ